MGKERPKKTKLPRSVDNLKERQLEFDFTTTPLPSEIIYTSNSEFESFPSASASPFEKSQQQKTARTKVTWLNRRPNGFFEEHLGAAVISLKTLAEFLGVKIPQKTPSRLDSLRARVERREMGSSEHDLLYGALQDYLDNIGYNYTNKRILNDNKFQGISTTSNTSSYLDGEELGAFLDPNREKDRITIMRNRYLSVYGVVPFEYEIAGAMPWFVKGELLAYFLGLVDFWNQFGTADAKFGKKLAPEAAGLTFARGALVEKVRRVGFRSGSSDSKIFVSEVGLEQMSAVILAGHRHSILYVDGAVLAHEMGYDAKTAREIHNLMCKGMDQIVARMIRSGELKAP